jgi:hypothetical protein
MTCEVGRNYCMSIFKKSRHLGFDAFIDIWSMLDFQFEWPDNTFNCVIKSIQCDTMRSVQCNKNNKYQKERHVAEPLTLYVNWTKHRWRIVLLYTRLSMRINGPFASLAVHYACLEVTFNEATNDPAREKGERQRLSFRKRGIRQLSAERINQ